MSGSGRKPFRISGSGREAVTDVREWEGVPPGCARVFGRPSWMSAIGRQVHYGFCYLRVLREWSRRPPGCPGVVGRPFRMSGSGRQVFPDVREWSGGPSGCSGLVGRPSLMSRSGQ